ncbi:Aldo/keto reductase subgroup [Penicillium lagena]|uniref:Aldo/keto reductase subgroup n=1 Tax=Penicillium lagena TaxID=94218 RepID=UPI0025423DA3|nr:Aldo/keto reductase subgroup [Penicillium lagena]KAJ5601959.1 Aldo/keto reductase subgroup [Penicillium lagena]
MATTLQSTYKLVSGFEIPVVGFGVDSAKVYGNEKESASAIRQSGLPRSQIFYTSKVPKSLMGYEKAKQAIEESIAAANLGYIDLYGPSPFLPSSPLLGAKNREN